MRLVNILCTVVALFLVVFFAFNNLEISKNESSSIRKPNVLVLLVDNLEEQITNDTATVHIQQIAKTGTTFSKGYCTSVLPSASEISILTGKIPTQNILPNINIINKDILLSEILQKENYKTHIAGNWQFNKQGFIIEGSSLKADKFNISNNTPKDTFQDLSTNTIQFLKENRESPFMALLSLTSLNLKETDKYIGELLKALDTLQARDNTIVILTSSQTNSNHISSLYKVPYVINVPWLKHKSKVIDTPVTGTDIYATILDLTGSSVTKYNDGLSLKPLLAKGQLDDRALVWSSSYLNTKSSQPYYIVQKNNWRLVHYYKHENDQLYNLHVQAQSNVIKHYSIISEQLYELLFTHLHNTDATYPPKLTDNSSSYK